MHHFGRLAIRLAIITVGVTLNAGCCWMNPYLGGSGTLASPYRAHREGEMTSDLTPAIVQIRENLDAPAAGGDEFFFNAVDGCPVAREAQVLEVTPGEHSIELGFASRKRVKDDPPVEREFTATGSATIDFRQGGHYFVASVRKEYENETGVMIPARFVAKLSLTIKPWIDKSAAAPLGEWPRKRTGAARVHDPRGTHSGK
jgi:hypothetical protein